MFPSILIPFVLHHDNIYSSLFPLIHSPPFVFGLLCDLRWGGVINLKPIPPHFHWPLTSSWVQPMNILTEDKRTGGQRSHEHSLKCLELLWTPVTVSLQCRFSFRCNGFVCCCILGFSTPPVGSLSPSQTSLNKANCAFYCPSGPWLVKSFSLHLTFSNFLYANMRRDVNGSWDREKMSLIKISLICSLISLAPRVFSTELYPKVHGYCNSICFSFSKSTSHSWGGKLFSFLGASPFAYLSFACAVSLPLWP